MVIKWAVKNIGLICVALAICCLCAEAEKWRVDYETLQSKVVCISSQGTLADAIDEKMLQRFGGK